MSTHHSKHWFLIGIAACAIILGTNGLSKSNPMPPERADEEEKWKDLKYQRASECTRCHVQPRPDDLPKEGELRALDIVLLTEYSIWKTHDKHAQAYAVLEGPRGKRMGDLLGQDVLKSETGCLNCHAMFNYVQKADSRGGLELKDGVSCGGCHGPSGGRDGWYGPHSQVDWRDVSPEDKKKRGLRDLRDPATRATLCLSCHVGNVAEGKVVTHAMFAAGHPPLPPIEIASFSRNEPQHWRDAAHVPFFQNLDKLKDADRQARIKNFHLEDLAYNRTKFALVGAVVSMRETLRLAQQQAETSLREHTQTRWPEIALAHSDCYACHHDLKFPGYRQTRGFGYQMPDLAPVQVAPGRVMIRTWPTAPLVSTLDFLGKPGLRNDLHAQLKGLAAAVSGRQYGSPEEVLARTTEAMKWCDTILADVKATKFDAVSVQRLMLSLCESYEKKDGLGRPILPDYEMARLVASVLAIAYDDWSASGGKHKNAEGAKTAKAVFAALNGQLDLEPYTRRKARLDVVFDIVAQGKPLEGKDEFKQYLANKDTIANLDELKKLAKSSPFLEAIRGISNDDFNKGLLTDKNIKELQKQGDEEEDAVLKSISNYDPDAFKKELKKLVETLK